MVYAALQDIAPAVKLWFTPNVSGALLLRRWEVPRVAQTRTDTFRSAPHQDESDYDSYFPDDPSTVALIGIDYYPSSLSDNSFLDKMQGACP